MADASHRLAACVGKTGYLTWDSAHKVAERMRRSNGVPSACYRCRFCQQWHIGETERKSWKKRRQGP